ncbi:MAG: ribonuclease HII [Candidatus Aenigmarchaeota archaeon ex4484_224]|nr:MAG: ribonuclease HII [Candidatus Aenigmarchaeota archaeon ex4484_224]
MRVLGIDEAGRGSIIGPMIIAGVVFDSRDKRKLKKIGVKDSKQLTKRKREEIYEFLQDIAKDIFIIKVSPCKIDSENLNSIEMKKIAQIIEMSDANFVYIDALTSRPKKFVKKLRELLNNKKIKIKAENKMDEKNLFVGAASIIAKVERDWEIEKIKKDVNFDFGIGYPHDPKTIEFVKKCIEDGNDCKYIRWKWDTVKKIVRELEENGIKIDKKIYKKAKIRKSIGFQRKLKEFLRKKL